LLLFLKKYIVLVSRRLCNPEKIDEIS